MLIKGMIHDVVPAKDDWERGFAHLAYLHVGLNRTFSTRILVLHEKKLGDYYDMSPDEGL